MELVITSSVLILAILALRILFAKKVSRRLIYGAWALVALRLLIPVQIGQLDFSVLTAAQPVVEVAEEQVKDAVLGTTPQAAYRDQVEHYIENDQTVFVPQVQEQIRQEQAQGNQTPGQIYDKIQQQFPEQEILTPEGRETVAVLVGMENTTRLHNAGMVLTTIWIVGMAVMAAWFVAVNAIYSRKLKKDRQKLDTDCPLTVYVSEKAASPCLMGLFRPVIYLTPAAAASEETRRYVMAHELTHRRHWDHIWSPVRCLCLCVYWFHPLVWVAAWCSRRDCELACDEGALKTLAEEERIAYGKSLVDVVSHATAPSNLLHTATSMNERGKQLKERVNFIVKKRKNSIIAAVCMVILCAIVAGCAAAGAANSWEKMEKQIQEDAVKAFCTEKDACEPEDVFLELVSQVDDTYVMFVNIPGWCYLTVITKVEIGGLMFHYSDSQEMYAYRDGSFLNLKEAYASGWLNDWQLLTVWMDYATYKRQYPQTNNPNPTEGAATNPTEPTEGAATNPTEPTDPTQPSTGDVQLGKIYYEANTVTAAVFPEEDYGNGYPIALIINSRTGLEGHLSRLGYPEYLQILQAAEQYDDAFFESYSLILVWNTPGSSADEYRVNAVTRVEADMIEISMCKELSETDTEDPVSKLIFIETDTKISEKTVVKVTELVTTEPAVAVFNMKNIAGITFYAYYGGGQGSDVPAENMAEIMAWLKTFTVGQKAPDILPPGTGFYQVEIWYTDGTVIKQSLDTITIDGVIYYLNSDPYPEIFYEMIAKVSP